MKQNFTRTTLLLLTAWLCFQNFNLPTKTLEAGHRLLVGQSCGKSSLSTAIVFQSPAHAYRIKKVVIDAGHGGKDPGCSGKHSKEKHNALAVALQLGAYIEVNFPEIKVIYTRDKDVFIELNERAAIANRENADLFISVHCNSVGAKHIQGTETYVMGLHTAQHNLEVAKRENAAIFYEDNYKKNYEGYDPNSPETHILSALWQSAYLEQSILFASLVQKFANSKAGRDDKGVKQAGFLVLRETAMPSVLVETGYLTNDNDERFLASEEGREQMAAAIFEAFKSYKKQMETGSPEPEIVVKKAETPRKLNPQKTSGTPQKKQVSQSKTIEQGAELLKKKKPEHDSGWQQSAPNELAWSEDAAQAVKILLGVSRTRLDLEREPYNLISNIEEQRDGTGYRYFVGTFASQKEAEPTLRELKNLGFKNAEIVMVGNR